MTPDDVLAEIERYESQLSTLLASFENSGNGLFMPHENNGIYRQYVFELSDLYNDALGENSYSKQIIHDFATGKGIHGSPSYRGVDNVLSVVRSSITRLRRNPDLLHRSQVQDNLLVKNNVFIIYGRDEAKWRELKDIVSNQFRLNPIVLMDQPDAGSETIIEKFERHAETCSYAIAIFTPDDVVTQDGESYLQARPNVIYELGWFCGRLNRKSSMLLLKEGTSMFSDFGGIIQKRFRSNVSEIIGEMRRDMVAAGVLPNL